MTKTNNNYCGLCKESQCVCTPEHFTPGNNTNPSPSSDLGKTQNPSSDLGTTKSSSNLASKDNPPPNTEFGPDGKPWDDTVEFDEDELPNNSSSEDDNPPEETIHEVVNSPVVTEPPVENDNPPSSGKADRNTPPKNTSPVTVTPQTNSASSPSISPLPKPIPRNSQNPKLAPKPPTTVPGFTMPGTDPNLPGLLTTSSSAKEIHEAERRMYQNFDAVQWQEFRTQSRLNGETYPEYEKDSFLLKPAKQLKRVYQRYFNNRIHLYPEISSVLSGQGKLLGFIMDKNRVNSLVSTHLAYNLLKTPFLKEVVEDIESQIDDLNSYVDVEVPSYSIPAINSNPSDTIPPLVEDAPYIPGGISENCTSGISPHPMPRDLALLPFGPRDHADISIRQRVGALSVSPEAQPHTPSQSDSPPPIQTPYSVLKFTERLPSDINSELNKSITPPVLKTLDDPDVMIHWIGDYMSFCLAQPDYKQPTDKPLGQATFFYDIGRIAASDADTRWVPRLIDFRVQQQLSYLGKTTKDHRNLFIEIVLRRQFREYITARNKINEVVMNWNIRDHEDRWLDFIRRFDKILNRSTLMRTSKANVYSSLEERVIIKALLTNVGIASVYLTLWPEYKDSKDLHTFFAVALEHYNMWCKRWEHSPAHVQREQKDVEILVHRDKDSWNDLPKAMQRSATKSFSTSAGHKSRSSDQRVAPSPSPSFKKKNRSEKKDPSEKDPNKCSFCDSSDHKIIHCNHPDCRRSELPADQRLPRSEAKKPPSRGNSSRKHNKYSKYIVQHINHIHNNTSSSDSHNPYANPLHNISNSSGTNSLSLNSIFSIIDHQDPPPFLSCSLTINGVSIQGLWDSGASMSVITQDLVDRCSMTFINKKVPFTSANNVRSHSLGSAQGILTFKFSKVSHLTSVTKTLPIIPGSNKCLLGIDLMKQLGLLTEEGPNHPGSTNYVSS
ncbi:hypothetical protein GEMRC1_005774 [Eukaryota sp. GEM-RC1]